MTGHLLYPSRTPKLVLVAGGHMETNNSIYIATWRRSHGRSQISQHSKSGISRKAMASKRSQQVTKPLRFHSLAPKLVRVPGGLMGPMGLMVGGLCTAPSMSHSGHVPYLTQNFATHSLHTWPKFKKHYMNRHIGKVAEKPWPPREVSK